MWAMWGETGALQISLAVTTMLKETRAMSTDLNAFLTILPVVDEVREMIRKQV
jgi:hypothetical protein